MFSKRIEKVIDGLDAHVGHLTGVLDDFHKELGKRDQRIAELEEYIANLEAATTRLQQDLDSVEYND